MTATLEATTIIHAPLETVFRYVTDLGNLPRWVGPVNSVSTVAGPAAVGATAGVNAYLIGKSVDTTLRVTKLRDNESFGYAFPEDTYGKGFDFSFERTSDGQAKVLMKYVLADNSLFSGNEEDLTRNLQASLESLRENIEA